MDHMKRGSQHGQSMAAERVRKRLAYLWQRWALSHQKAALDRQMKREGANAGLI